jgi:hypothetical protein
VVVKLPIGVEGLRQGWVAGALGAAVIAVGYTLCRRAIIPSDEGYLLQQALDMANGSVLYRDMDAFVAPGVWLLLAGLFRVVEPSVLASRLAVLVCYVATVGVGVTIVARIASRRFAVAAVAAFLVLTVWAFPAWTWSFYSPWSVLFALIALERLLAWREAGRSRDLVWMGVWLGLSIVFKQNFGVLASVGAALGVAAIRVERGAALRALPAELGAAGLRTAAGAAAVGLPVVAWLAAHGALDDAFRSLVLHPFGGFLGRHDIPYLPPAEILERRLMAGMGRYTYGSFGFTNSVFRLDWPEFLVRGIEILHVLLYWLPPLVFAVAAVLVVLPLRSGRPLDGGLACVFGVGALLFPGVFPQADYNHLVNVYQPVVVLGAVVAHRLFERRSALPAAPRRVLAGLAALLAASYAGVAGYWYVDILGSLTEPVGGRRGGVLVSPEAKQMYDFEVSAIQSMTQPGEPVLTLPALSMLNFLADRPVPSRYYNLYAVHIAHDGGAGVVRGAEQNGVRLVVADYDDFFSERARLRKYAPELTRYLQRVFEPMLTVSVDERIYLRRRPRPLPDREVRSVLGSCDVAEAFDWTQRGTQGHLLFETLYHPHEPKGQPARRSATTLCRVQVPPGAVLAFALGFRQPSEVEPGTRVTAEVWIRSGRGAGEPPELLRRDTVEPLSATDWASPAPLEQRIDLSGWGGQEVLLIFRSLYRGAARMNLLDFRGFPVFWQDPRLEFEAEPGGTRPEGSEGAVRRGRHSGRRGIPARGA